ncbi:MAG: hypothetical protein TEF_08630 [Rhizobiales bacterium NRL2]|jgi:N-acyl-D-aspartate/D-glutamate deacylase|nr:MAG: hypothetical protein TEF_08630 [Rhizobiales bacterium NRL2]
MLDLVIKNARVLDGTGAAEQLADVGVKDGRVTEIGRLSDAAAETVDADGLVLAPGIVDIHTHYDAQVTWDQTLSPSPSLGVTTVVMGNCGFTVAPCPHQYNETVLKNLSVVEGMDLEALLAGVNWGFETFPEYLEFVRSRGIYANVAAFVGHSTIRTVVMGEDAWQRKEATEDEMKAMEDLIRQAMNGGAIGFASSFSPNHSGYDGIPMPSTIATEGELAKLVGVLGEYNHGVFQCAYGLKLSLDWLEDLAAKTGATLSLSSVNSMFNDANPTGAYDALDRCAQAIGRGHRMYHQVTAQPLSMDFTGTSAYPLHSHDAFAPYKAADAVTLKKTYADPEFREGLRQNLAHPKAGVFFTGNWERVSVAVPALKKNEGLTNRSIAEIARERGADPLDTLFDLWLEEDLKTVMVGKFLNVNEDGAAPLLKHDAGVIALSDAGAHLIFMCDAGLGLYVLGRWVRERGDLALPEAVRRLTSHPADLYGLQGRGRIVPGGYADLMLFDPDKVGISPPKRVPDLPGGGMRAIREPLGMHGVWCNGRQVFDGKDYVEHRTGPGSVLDKFN